VSGGDLFVTSVGAARTIGKYTTSGATVNSALITWPRYPSAIAVSGERLFVTNEDVPDASSTWTLLLLGLTATFGLKLVLHQRV